MRLFIRIAGMAALFLSISAIQACQQEPPPPQKNPMQTAQIGVLKAQVAVYQEMVTQSAAGYYNGQLQLTAQAIGTEVRRWDDNRMLYYENFQDGEADWFGQSSVGFAVTADTQSVSNLVWSSTSPSSGKIFNLPKQMKAYVIEFRLKREPNSNGVAGVFFQDENSACPNYQLYFLPANSQIMLNELDGSCHATDDQITVYPIPPSSDGWYKLKVEVDHNAIQVYRDDGPEPIVSSPGRSDDLLAIDTIGFWTCCQDSLPYTFYIDDIQVWQPGTPTPVP